MKLAIALALCTSTAAFAAPTCKQSQDDVSCTVTVKEAGQQANNLDLAFPLFSSTFLCDGKPNQFVSKDLRAGDYAVQIVADWEGLRLSVYAQADTARADALAEMHSPRSNGVAGQSVFYRTGAGSFVQVLCSGKRTKN
jgi:hypothetical protein